MNSELLKVMHDCGLSEAQGMNKLQEAGVISDLCVWVADVAESDVPNAVNYLKNQHEKSKTENR